MTVTLVAWLVAGVALFVWGLAAAVAGRLEERLGTAFLTMLGGAVLILSAFVRHEVLDGAGVPLALVIIVGGGVLLADSAPDREDRA